MTEILKSSIYIIPGITYSISHFMLNSQFYFNYIRSESNTNIISLIDNTTSSVFSGVGIYCIILRLPPIPKIIFSGLILGISCCKFYKSYKEQYNDIYKLNHFIEKTISFSKKLTIYKK